MSKIKSIISKIEWSMLSPAVITRYALGIISIINIILDKTGTLPLEISESTVYSVCSIVFALIMIIVNTYKNNSTSSEAMIADRVMVVLKALGRLDSKAPALNQIEQLLTDIESQISDYSDVEDALDVIEDQITNNSDND